MWPHPGVFHCLGWARGSKCVNGGEARGRLVRGEADHAERDQGRTTSSKHIITGGDGQDTCTLAGRTETHTDQDRHTLPDVLRDGTFLCPLYAIHIWIHTHTPTGIILAFGHLKLPP